MYSDQPTIPSSVVILRKRIDLPAGIAMQVVGFSYTAIGPALAGSSPILRLYDRRCWLGVGIFYTPNSRLPITTYWKQREQPSTASSTTVGIFYTSTYRSLDASLEPPGIASFFGLISQWHENCRSFP